MIYIIMCGGEYTAWETPRQLLEIRGETIVGRTIRMLREAGIKDIAISASDPRFERFGVSVLRHDNDFRVTPDGIQGCWAHAFWPTQDPACYVFGDVVFSPGAIHTICRTDTDGIRFYASVPPFSRDYIKRYAEPFAFKVRDQRKFRRAIDWVAANADSGVFSRPPIAWELWQVIIGGDPRQIDYQTITKINDWTCDVDTPEDIRRLEAIVCS